MVKSYKYNTIKSYFINFLLKHLHLFLKLINVVFKRLSYLIKTEFDYLH